jgi:hypothetical protein
MKTLEVEAELFQEGGRTDMMKLIVAFRNFSNEPKKRNKKCWVRVKVKCISCVYYIYIYIYVGNINN